MKTKPHNSNKKPCFWFVFTSLFILLFSCQRTTPTVRSFTFPEICDTLPESDFCFSPYHQWHAESYIHQVKKVGEKVDPNADLGFHIKPGQENDSIYQISAKTTGLTLYVDTVNEVSMSLDGFIPPPYFSFIQSKQSIDKNYRPSVTDSIADTLMMKEVRSYLRYIKTVHAYPVYIVNSTDSIIVVTNEMHLLKLIQEAKDPDNNWKPVEHYDYLNGDFRFSTPVILYPGHFIMTKIFKYSGNYKTMIRLKFRNGNTIIYSDPFFGSINKEQFDYLKNPASEMLKELYF
jgi:hypothetical protein